ncbi:SGNH/GDSL hydrolase family protein [Deinococcus peraridilitoris]|uniref:Lysophospholipase L1-like esterase n=1 Tax=Deinococcus peraridilitoris (strain DSM 19664 / LMG 22246 / CIP 109416 / KR-200) TaxID=937777 RepID=K9ZZN4_DEIPD|nr:GDSL-type esterase/lipase family protein [Deinococcus peraridilitoris]AFZ66220.1 lysophospholipase L1-like esterase [Deinococcus peraridilitoris DSM 19664]
MLVPLIFGSCGTPVQMQSKAKVLPSECSSMMAPVRGELMGEAAAPLRIVALGSSSTFGEGASSRSSNYPARLQSLLDRAWGKGHAQVFNKGVNGDTLQHMVARLDRDVYALRPNVVLWQTGTNDAIKKADPQQFRRQLRSEIDKLHGHGVSVILLDSQYLRPEQRPHNYEVFQQAVWDVAAESNTPLLPRYRIMERLLVSGQYRTQDLMSADGLHLNDFSYECLATYASGMLAPLFSARLAQRP